MSCPYYTFRSNDYYCMKKSDYVNSDVYQRYCKNYSYDECPIYKGNQDSGGCYLTSACVKAKGLPDNCYELETLREFRDNWLKKQSGGPEEIAEYYATAPKIVTQINRRGDAKQIWRDLYNTLVMPCIQLIQTGKPEEARALYKKTALDLKERFA